MKSNKYVYLVVGLPGSGKTYYSKNILAERIQDYYLNIPIVFDDFTEQNLSSLKQYLNTDYEVHIIINDINFCFPDRLNACLSFLQNQDISNIKIFSFENNPEQCIRNVKYRDDGRTVLGCIKILSRIYDPNIIVNEKYKPNILPVWDCREKFNTKTDAW